jgi:hypothetical protein
MVTRDIRSAFDGRARSTPSSSYAVGVELLTRGKPDALETLAEAVAEQPGRAPAHIALACAYAVAGDNAKAEACRADAIAHLNDATRRERQHVEVLAAVLEDHLGHAFGLAFEHLREFNGDELVLYMLSDAVTRHSDPGLSTELDSLLELVQRQEKSRLGRS